MDTEKETIEKYLERLNGYACGNHIQLKKQMLNRLKDLRNRENKEKSCP